MNPRVRPFIVELLILIFVVFLIFIALLFTDTIVIKLNVLAVLCFITFLWIVQYIFTFMIRDVLAIFDLI